MKLNFNISRESSTRKPSFTRWWRDQFVTLLVIPERTRRVHKVILPFLFVKLSIILCSVFALFLIVIGIDYIQVLGRLAENKRLKGENFKLRQEMQLIRNKVESMESTVERVRNYAKKLQMLTGQTGGKAGSGDVPMGPVFDEDAEGGAPMKPSRVPAKQGEQHSELMGGSLRKANLDNIQAFVLPTSTHNLSLNARVEGLRDRSRETETELSKLQVYLLAQSAVAAATPSILPIAGWISSSFGYRRHPYDGSYRLHSGVDIAAEAGTPVRAPADGTVIFSGYKEGYGKVAVLNHGYGIHTVFAHNSKLFVNPGDRVKKRQVISEVGSTGRSTAPHLHYEIRKNGVPINPVAFFSRSRF